MLSRRVKVAVSRAYRGASGPDFEVMTGEGGGDCGYSFVVGQRYLIYAHREPGVKARTTGICSLTKPIASAQEDLAYLDGLDTRPPGTSVRGHAWQFETASDRDHDQLKSPAVGVTVRLSSEAASFEVIADERGAFATSSTPYEFELPDLRACAELVLSVQFDGRVESRLVAPDGAAIPDTQVRQHWADSEDERSYIDIKRTDGTGRFSFGPLSPGRYRLEVGVARMYDDDIPYPPTWYPGVPFRDQSLPVEVGPGEHVLLEPFRVPQKLRRIVVKGRVTWPRPYDWGRSSSTPTTRNRTTY